MGDNFKMSLKATFKKVFKSAKTKIIGVLVIAFLASGLALSSIKLASADVTTNDVSAETASDVSSCNPDSDPTNSVIYCGVSSVAQLQNYYNNGDVSASGDNSDSGASIRNIYQADPFDISSADINNMTSETQSGYVTKSGDVYLNDGTLVATNALTAGRDDISGSTAVTNNGTIFYERPPSVSFLEDQLSALVVMENGVFKFAVLTSCGNPVHATPKLPNYTILKQVKTEHGSYTTNVTTTAGSIVDYKITVTSNGAVPAVNVLIKDDLQSSIEYKSGTLEQNGTTAGPGVANAFFNGGITIPSIKDGTAITFTFEAVVEPNVTSQTCKTGEVPNMATISSQELPTELSRAYVDVECSTTPPSPSLTCVDLSLGQPSAPNGQGNIPYTLTATATANDAKITDYVFSFNNTSGGSAIAPQTVTTSSDSATLTQDFVPGQYNVTVTVEGTEESSSTKVTNTSANCAKELTASTSPVCTAPNGSTFPEGSAECNATTNTPLANTGPGNDALVFLLSSVGGSGVYLLVVKKHLITKILK